jgi:signal transduction histidine kinase
MKNSLTSTKPITSLLPLVFLYDAQQQEVVFINQSSDQFFGSLIDWQSTFPFASFVAPADAVTSAIEWQKCLLLKAKQQHEFSITLFIKNQLAGFTIQASHFPNEKDEQTTTILFTVTKLPGRENNDPYKQEYNEFIDIAAHDLDAPLRKLNVLIERLTSKYNTEEEEIKNYTQRINSCVTSMRSLIDDLASLSKVNTTSLKIVSCDTGMIVREILKELAPIIQGKKASVTYEDLPAIEADKAQLHQLLKHVLQNALTFTNKNVVPVIAINSEILTPEENKYHGLLTGKNYYKIDITDNGAGFNPEMAGKIFRPFVRLHSKSAFAGNGIGLAICNRIIKNHGGKIYAVSNENAGSRFTIILPETLVQHAELP